MKIVFAKKTTVIIGILLVALAIGGCSWFGDKQSKTLRYAVGAEPESLDPRKSTSIAAGNIEAQLFEGLTTLDSNNAPVPAAAERWEVSPDGLTYTFYLRQGLKWSNGDPVTAEDFEYAWKTALSKEMASDYAYQLFYLKNGEAYNAGKVEESEVGVKAVGNNGLQVTLEKPVPYFLSLISCQTYYPVNKKLATSNENWAADAKSYVGNGPFKMTSWTHQDKVEVVKNDQYWDAAKVKLPGIQFSFVESNSTVLTMFENNQLDMAENPPVTELPRLQKEGKVKVYPSLGTYYYSFNVRQAPFDNPKVRKAFSLAINRQDIVSRVLRGGQKIALAIVPYGVPDVAAGEDFRVKGGDYIADNDVATAQKLLTEAGYPGGKGLPTITLLYNTSDNNKVLAEAVQEMLKKNLGVTVELTNQERKVFYDTLDSHNFQFARDEWVGDYDDAMTFMELFETGNRNNNSGYSNPAYDALIQTARNTTDQAVRIKAMHDAEKLLVEDSPIIPMYFYADNVLITSHVKDIVRTIMGTVYLKGAYIE
ncbi:MAG: oppA 2 [Firmicutes bacterium]|nr:oppA 2 [Bacillota bacterium]